MILYNDMSNLSGYSGFRVYAQRCSCSLPTSQVKYSIQFCFCELTDRPRSHVLWRHNSDSWRSVNAAHTAVPPHHSTAAPPGGQCRQSDDTAIAAGHVATA